MAADPDLLAALQAAHDAEATASELWHKTEHEYKQGELKACKLGRYFDRQHKAAFKRQHDLRGHMMSLGGKVETNLGDTAYDQGADGVAPNLKRVCDTIDGLRDAYDGVRSAAKDAGDSETREKFHGVAKRLGKLYRKGEQKQQQLKTLGLELFIHKHS